VEDEPELRSLTRLILQREGYAVVTAADGRAAVRCFEMRPADTFDLVLTDLKLPDMSGEELAESVRTLNPAVRILFTSGYSTHDISEDNCRQFIPKPCTPAALVRRVGEALADPVLSAA
jgi:CheY-like chemotaxis protein